MFWNLSLFTAQSEKDTSTELSSSKESDIVKQQTVTYGSLEQGHGEKRRRGSDASRALSPNNGRHHRNNNTASSSSLLGLLQQQKEIDESVFEVAERSLKPIIRQPQRDSPSILPFNSTKVTADEVPIQGEYIERIKTQFFNLGISTGASLQLFFVSFLLMFASASTNSGPILELSHEYYPVFRGILLICFFFSLYGANIFIWRRSRIDYLQVIGASYTHTYQYVLRGSTTMALITFTMFMLYFLSLSTRDATTGKAHAGSDIRHLWPALSVLLPILLFLCPWDSLTSICYGVRRNGFKQRYGLLKEIGYVLVSPFSEVTFLRSFIADIFCSMPRIFTDLQYTICIYATGTFLIEEPDDLGASDSRQHAYHTCGAGSRRYYILQIALGFLPYFIRLCQSIRAYKDTKDVRNLFNGLKYLLSMTVTGLAVAHTASINGTLVEEMSEVYRARLTMSWIAVGVVTTLYSFYWDVVMDWGLGSLHSTHYLLREKLSFLPHKYYASIGLDFVMRLGWAFVISPEQQYIQQNFMLLLSAVELVRRFLWSIYRVEWEYIQLSARNEAKNKKLKHDRLAGMFFHKNSTVEFGLTQVPLHDTIGMASNRSSFRSINTINTGLSLLTELDEREDMGRYALEEGSRVQSIQFSEKTQNSTHTRTSSTYAFFSDTRSESQVQGLPPMRVTSFCVSEDEYIRGCVRSPRESVGMSNHRENISHGTGVGVSHGIGVGNSTSTDYGSNTNGHGHGRGRRSYQRGHAQ